jgi:hypothetical protein
VPVPIAAHQALANQAFAVAIPSHLKIQAEDQFAHKIGYRPQFVQKIVYNLAATLRANSI